MSPTRVHRQATNTGSHLLSTGRYLLGWTERTQDRQHQNKHTGSATLAGRKLLGDPELWLLSCSPRRQKQPLTRKRSLLLELTSTTPSSDN